MHVYYVTNPVEHVLTTTERSIESVEKVTAAFWERNVILRGGQVLYGAP